MNYKLMTGLIALLVTTACQNSGAAAPSAAPAKTIQSEAEIAACIRTVMGLDAGRWNYMGTIGRVDGKFRTYEAVFVNAPAGPDMWSSKAFGGDVGGDEENAEEYYNKLVGATLVPLEDGELKHEEAYKYLSCVGPDAKGRYETRTEYKISTGDGGYVTSKNMTWYSEHGSYYAEDIYDASGQVNSRRSGVNTPFKDKT